MKDTNKQSKKRTTKSVSTWKYIIQIQAKAKIFFICIILANCEEITKDADKIIPLLSVRVRDKRPSFREAKETRMCGKPHTHTKCFLI